MKLRNLILSSTIILSSLCAGAQNKEKTELTFIPHWYIQGQFGAQETLGETGFGHLLSPNLQVAGGYRFNPYIGVRLALDSWQSKGAFEYKGSRNLYKWNFVAPTIDAVVDLTNLIGGYQERKISAGVIAGVGLNIGFSNGEAEDINNSLTAQNSHMNAMPLLWTGSKVQMLGKFGVYGDYNITNKISVGLEINANVLGDSYNSKRAHNSDWYFNALVGAKYSFGKTGRKRYVSVEPVAPVIKTVHDTVEVVKTVRDTVYVNKTIEKKIVETKEAPTLRRDIFFTLSNVAVAQSERSKVKEVADFMKKNPDCQVVITGYADKGTGSMKINLRLSKQRADTVAKELMNKYRIPSGRIIVTAMDERANQPYKDPLKNRVAICIIK